MVDDHFPNEYLFAISTYDPYFFYIEYFLLSGNTPLIDPIGRDVRAPGEVPLIDGLRDSYSNLDMIRS